jgi:replicative DNA helicase
LQTYLDKIENKKYKSIKDLLSEISKDTFQISNNSTDEDTSIKYAIDQFSLKQDKYEERLNSGEEYLGIATGIKSLDKSIEGLQPEHLITLSAFTSTGKSTMAMNIVKNLLNRDKRVCIFSLEMSKVDLIGKLLALETGIPTVRLIKGLRDDVVYAEQKLAKENLLNKKLIIYSEISNVEDIVLAMQSEMTKDKVDLFVIDYIQNITGAININEYQLMTYAIKLLQQVNRQLKSTLLMLSQVSNETIKSTETFNIQGKNSGSIRHASDVFIYLKRDATEDELTEIYNNGSDVPLKCIINKNRHGRIGSFKLNLKQKIGEFYEPI